MDGCGGKSNSFKLLLKSLLPTNKEDPFKNEGAKVVTTDLPLYNRSPIVSLCRFFYDAQGKLTPQSKVGSTLN